MHKTKVRLIEVSDFFKHEFTVGKEYETYNHKFVSDTSKIFFSDGTIDLGGYLDGFEELNGDGIGIKAVII